MQFEAQHRHYQQHYAGASFDLVLCDGEPAGRLYVYRSPAEYRIVDIASLADYQRRGIGTHLLRRIAAEASQHGVPVTIHVERENPALGWYEREGFRLVEDRGVYYFMARPPDREPT
jgi:ribosomal protein S18 acetylase RimI-like enzyme